MGSTQNLEEEKNKSKCLSDQLRILKREFSSGRNVLKKITQRNTKSTVFNSLFCIQPHYHQLYHLKLVHHLD